MLLKVICRRGLFGSRMMDSAMAPGSAMIASIALVLVIERGSHGNLALLITDGRRDIGYWIKLILGTSRHQGCLRILFGMDLVLLDCKQFRQKTTAGIRPSTLLCRFRAKRT